MARHPAKGATKLGYETEDSILHFSRSIMSSRSGACSCAASRLSRVPTHLISHASWLHRRISWTMLRQSNPHATFMGLLSLSPRIPHFSRFLFRVALRIFDLIETFRIIEFGARNRLNIWIFQFRVMKKRSFSWRKTFFCEPYFGSLNRDFSLIQICDYWKMMARESRNEIWLIPSTWTTRGNNGSSNNEVEKR